MFPHTKGYSHKEDVDPGCKLRIDNGTLQFESLTSSLNFKGRYLYGYEVDFS